MRNATDKHYLKKKKGKRSKLKEVKELCNKTIDLVYEHLVEQVQQEAIQVAEQEIARELILKASKK